MRFLLLALLASTGCEQILGLEDIDASFVDQDPDNVAVVGTVRVFGSSDGQNNIGVEVLPVAGGPLPGIETTTAGGGNYALTIPNDYSGYLHLFDEREPAMLRESYFHIAGTLPEAKFDVTMFGDAEVMQVRLSAGLQTSADLPFARVEVLDANSEALSGAEIFVAGQPDTPAPEIRYTDPSGSPVSPGARSTTLAVERDQNLTACAYVFGLIPGKLYEFTATVPGKTARIGHSILIADDSVPVVVLKFN